MRHIGSEPVTCGEEAFTGVARALQVIVFILQPGQVLIKLVVVWAVDIMGKLMM